MVELAQANQIAGAGDAAVGFPRTVFIRMIELTASGRLSAANEPASLIAGGVMIALRETRSIAGAAEI
jgi:hypothetical protein